MPSGIYKRTKEHIQRLKIGKQNQKEKFGYINSPEARKKMQISALNMTQEHKDKISNAKKGKLQSKEHIEKLSKVRKENFTSGKIVIWNKDLTKETDERVKRNGEQTSKTRKAMFRSGELVNHTKGKTKDNYEPLKRAAEKHTGFRHEESTKNEIALKCRSIRIKQIEKNYGICYPNYNPEASKFFKTFDEVNNTRGQYAMYGGGEYCIKELGYFLDYINFDLKLIIEVDESHHYDKNGNLRKKDIQRQNEIQELYLDFKFRRINEEFLLTENRL